LEKCRDSGKEALKAKPIPGRPPKLSGEPTRWIAGTVRDKYPLQLQHEGTATVQTFCTFLRRLAGGVEQTIFLILYGSGIHRARKVQRLLTGHDGKIRLFFLPPHSPQLNPDEWLWGQGKRRVGKQPIQTKADLKQRFIAALRSLQRSPSKIRGFIQIPSCRFALAQ
jgi:transposase